MFPPIYSIEIPEVKNAHLLNFGNCELALHGYLEISSEVANCDRRNKERPGGCKVILALVTHILFSWNS